MVGPKVVGVEVVGSKVVGGDVVGSPVVGSVVIGSVVIGAFIVGSTSVIGFAVVNSGVLDSRVLGSFVIDVEVVGCNVIGIVVTGLTIEPAVGCIPSVGECDDVPSAEGLVAKFGGGDGPGAGLGGVTNAGLVSFPHLKTGTFSKVPSRDLLLCDNLQGVVLFPGTI